MAVRVRTAAQRRGVLCLACISIFASFLVLSIPVIIIGNIVRWRPISYVDRVIFAANSSSVSLADELSAVPFAWIEVSYEETICMGCKEPARRNFWFDIFTGQDLSGEGASRAGKRQFTSPGPAAAGFYYMQQAQYILFSTQMNDTSSPEITTILFQKLNLNATAIRDDDEEIRPISLFSLNTKVDCVQLEPLPTTNSSLLCPRFEVIPSPDGAHIVSIFAGHSSSSNNNNGNNSSANNAAIEIQIEFFAASSLNRTHVDQIAINIQASDDEKAAALLAINNNNNGIDWTWLSNGSFVVADQATNTSWIYDIIANNTNNEEEIKVSEVHGWVPACFEPKTTSSSVSANGVHISIAATATAAAAAASTKAPFFVLSSSSSSSSSIKPFGTC